MTRLTIPAEVARLEEIRAFVRVGAEAGGMAAEQMNWLDLILEELFVNVARYAYTPASGAVEVAYALDSPGRLRVEIADSGREFNPLAADPPDFSRGLAERPLGGMGIFLVKTAVDSIHYVREEGTNRLSFVMSWNVNNRTVEGDL